MSESDAPVPRWTGPVEFMSNALSYTTSDLAREQLSNGAVKVHLAGRQQHAVVARKLADGRIERTCVNDAQAYRRFVNAKPTERTQK